MYVCTYVHMYAPIDHRQRELISFFLSSATIQVRCRYLRSQQCIYNSDLASNLIHSSIVPRRLYSSSRLACPVRRGPSYIHVRSAYPIIPIDRLTYRITSIISITVRYSSSAQSSKVSNLSFMHPFSMQMLWLATSCRPKIPATYPLLSRGPFH